MPSSDDTTTNAEAEETMTIEEIAAMALRDGCPGPDVDEHPENHDGPCYG